MDLALTAADVNTALQVPKSFVPVADLIDVSV